MTTNFQVMATSKCYNIHSTGSMWSIHKYRHKFCYSSYEAGLDHFIYDNPLPNWQLLICHKIASVASRQAHYICLFRWFFFEGGSGLTKLTFAWILFCLVYISSICSWVLSTSAQFIHLSASSDIGCLYRILDGRKFILIILRLNRLIICPRCVT